MTRQLSRLQAVELGVVVVLGLAIAGWVLLNVDQRHRLGSGSITVEAGFSDIGGTDVGTRVRLQGIDVGEVVAVVPPTVPGGEVKLRIRLAGKVRHLVTCDSRVQIASENLFAGRIVNILPGKAGSAQIKDGASLAGAPSTEITEALANSTVHLSEALNEIDGLVKDFRRGQGVSGDISRDLAQVSSKLNRSMTQFNSMLDDVNDGKGTLGLLLKDPSTKNKVVAVLTNLNSILEDVNAGQGTLGLLLKDPATRTDVAVAAKEIAATTKDIHSIAEDISKGKGTLGMLARDPGIYNELVGILTSLKMNADAVKSMPVVRSYVIDPAKELIRPECQRDCKWFPEDALFTPGRAVLTADGRKRLDEAATWLNGHKEPGSEVLVAAFAAPNQSADVALTLTQRQSEVVCDYLRRTHAVHSTGWAPWSTRPVRPLGVGSNPPALPGTEKLPPARVELLVFIPGK